MFHNISRHLFLTSLTVQVFSTIMSTSIPAEGAVPTEKCKKSWNAECISSNINQVFWILGMPHSDLFSDMICFLALKGSVTFTYAAASRKVLLKISNKKTHLWGLGGISQTECQRGHESHPCIPNTQLITHCSVNQGQTTGVHFDKCVLQLQRQTMRREMTSGGCFLKM